MQGLDSQALKPMPTPHFGSGKYISNSREDVWVSSFTQDNQKQPMRRPSPQPGQKVEVGPGQE